MLPYSTSQGMQPCSHSNANNTSEVQKDCSYKELTEPLLQSALSRRAGHTDVHARAGSPSPCSHRLPPQVCPGIWDSRRAARKEPPDSSRSSATSPCSRSIQDAISRDLRRRFPLATWACYVHVVSIRLLKAAALIVASKSKR